MPQWYHDLIGWLRQLSWPQSLLLGGSLFVITFVGSLAFVTVVLIQLPANYFQDDHPRMFLWAERHPLLRLLALAVKNLVGVMLVLVGIVLTLPGVPGQGLLTILLGIMLLNFPGKRRLEQMLVRRPEVLATINRLRARFGRPPLVLDDPPPDAPVP
ncbi:MAG: hypothetical protein NZ700_11405 [Gemmataceae bacterium]|nr:hypothetical protein [Gemmataceae bacterium]MDW8264316.1 hypothetical protein [Gemmataceae bacterium]